jgi:hypothetical protein
VDPVVVTAERTAWFPGAAVMAMALETVGEAVVEELDCAVLR